MSEQNNTSMTQTQLQRRAKYGLNVTVAIVVAVAIVVLLNVIAFNMRDQLGRSARLDLTATRQYSLSEQTVRVLDDMEGSIEIITLFQTPDRDDDANKLKQIQDARDLVDEYARLSNHITSDHIDPVRQPDHYESFKERLRDHYADELAPLKEVTEQAISAMKTVTTDLSAHIEPLENLAKHPDARDAGLRRQLVNARQAFENAGPQIEAELKQVEATMSDTLPDYTGAYALLLALFKSIDAQLYDATMKVFTQLSQQVTVPNNVREGLLEQVDALKVSRKKLQDVLSQLQMIQAVKAYDDARISALRRDQVVLMGGKEIRAISLADMFPPVAKTDAGDAEMLDWSFLGEEKITGSILAMTMKSPPMVVFVSGGRVPPIGARVNPSFSYEIVAQRLRNMNFDVKTWVPAAAANQFTGQAAQSPPEPAEGQKAIWIILAEEEMDPRNPVTFGSRQRVADHLKKRLEAGDAALFMLGISNNTIAGQSDVMEELIKPFGITPQMDRFILREEIMEDESVQPSPYFLLSQWPTDMVISKALQGMPALFMSASPLVIDQSNLQQKSPQVIGQLQAPRMWAERDISPDAPPDYDQETARETFTIAVAAKNDKNRIVVVSDPVWAADSITSSSGYRQVGEFLVRGARFPGNAELFVNSVYWLAEMEGLIAASARTQDIKRIQQIDPGTLAALKWTLMSSMVLASLISGIVVWIMRQRG